MIFHITYISGGYRVKGYLGLPVGIELDAAGLQSMVEAHYGAAAGALPVSIVAERVRTRSVGLGALAAVDSAAALAGFPGFVYCRGGVGGFGRVRPHWIDSFMSRGFVTFAPSYRGNDGGEGRDEFGGADREDVHAGIRLLQALPWVRGDRITVMGFSRGAINAAVSAAELGGGNEVHRLVLWSGVADLARTYEERVDLRRTLKRILGGTPAKVPYAYRARSPLHLAEQLVCPVLVGHGTLDEQVDVGHGVAMYQRLLELGRSPAVDIHLYEGYGHLLPYLVHEAAVDRMFDWVRRDSY